MSDAWQELGRRVEQLAREDRFSGSVLATRGAQTLLDCPAGLADRANRTPVTAATRFAVASLSKMFTAATVLTLVREGRLALTDRVAALLPATRRPRTLADEVTVEHLLTHTAGLGDYAEEDEDRPDHVADYASLWHDLPVHRMQRPDDFLPLYADAAPVGPPGVSFHYSNAGFVLLGALVEEVAGQPFIGAVAERVFGPAGMTGAGYLRSDDAHPDVATGYLPGDGPGALRRSNVFSVPVVGGGDGGAHVTSRDVDGFLRAIVSGALLGEELSDQMRALHVPVHNGIGMGLGVFVRADGSFGHGGGDPGVETLCRHWPERSLTLVVLANEEGTLDPVWEELLAVAGVA